MSTPSIIRRMVLVSNKLLTTTEFKPPAQLLSPWLRRGSIALLHARPGTKKTYLALAIALAVSRGDSLLGWKPTVPGKARRVLYLDAEMPRWLLCKRLQQLEAGKIAGKVSILSRESLIDRGIPMPDLG